MSRSSKDQKCAIFSETWEERTPWRPILMRKRILLPITTLWYVEFLGIKIFSYGSADRGDVVWALTGLSEMIFSQTREHESNELGNGKFWWERCSNEFSETTSGPLISHGGNTCILLSVKKVMLSVMKFKLANGTGDAERAENCLNLKTHKVAHILGKTILDKTSY